MRTDRLLLVLLAAALAALGGALAVSSLAGGAAALVYPGAPEELIAPDTPAAIAATPGARSDVRVEIEPIARIVELPPEPRCWLRRHGATEPVPARVRWLAGSAAMPIARDRATGPQLVRIELDGGDALYRVVHIDAATGAAEVWLEGPFAFAGRVAGEDGQPIAGAQVWLAGRPEVSAGADGTFVVEGLRSRTGLPLVIRAAGRADHFRVVEIGAPGTPAPVFVLEHGAALQVRFAGAVPADGRATVWLRPARGAGEGDVGLLHYPFFWPLVGGGAPAGADGTWRLDGLPAGADVEVVVHDPRAPAAVAAVALRGTQQSVVVVGEPGPTVAGRIVDAAGDPAAAVLVVSRARDASLAAEQRQGVLLPASAQLAPLAHTATAADGSFVLARRASADADLVAFLPVAGPGLEQEIAPGAAVEDAQLALPSPAAPAGRPCLRLIASRPLRVHVVRGRARDAAIELDAERPHELWLRAPVLLDITVRSADGERRIRGLAVRGVVDVRL